MKEERGKRREERGERKKQRPRPKGAAVQQSKNHILQKEYFYLKAVLLLLKNLVPGNSATLAAYLIF